MSREHARLLALHDAAVAEGRDTYVDPSTGYHVMTATKLAQRGRCCGNGCRHCPYPEDQQRRAGRPPSKPVVR